MPSSLPKLSSLSPGPQVTSVLTVCSLPVPPVSGSRISMCRAMSEFNSTGLLESSSRPTVCRRMCSIKFGCVVFWHESRFAWKEFQGLIRAKKNDALLPVCLMIPGHAKILWQTHDVLLLLGGCLQATRVLLFCFVCCQLPRSRDLSSRCFLDRCIRCANLEMTNIACNLGRCQLNPIDYYIINNIFPSIADNANTGLITPPRR